MRITRTCVINPSMPSASRRSVTADEHLYCRAGDRMPNIPRGYRGLLPKPTKWQQLPEKSDLLIQFKPINEWRRRRPTLIIHTHPTQGTVRRRPRIVHNRPTSATPSPPPQATQLLPFPFAPSAPSAPSARHYVSDSIGLHRQGRSPSGICHHLCRPSQARWTGRASLMGRHHQDRPA